MGNSICDMGICRCPDGYVLEDGTCISASAKPGDNCQQGQKCEGGSICQFGVCMCSAGYTVVIDQCVRISRNEILDATILPVPPVESFCANCTGTEPYNQERQLLVAPGGWCSESSSSICGGGSQCFANHCTCPMDTYISGEKCEKTEGKTATTDDYDTSTVVEEDFLTQLSKETESIWAYETSTDSSRSNNDHQAPFIQYAATAYPLDNSFIPPLSTVNLHYIYAFTTVLPTVQPAENAIGMPGQLCTNSGICYNGAHCEGNVCVCEPGYVIIDAFCSLKKVPLHEHCFTIAQCPPGAICLDSYCKCPLFSIEQQLGVCQKLQILKPGDNCSHEKLCGYSSVCDPHSGTCICPQGFVNFGDVCRDDVDAFPLNCNDDDDCHRTAYCYSGYCVCKDVDVSTGYCIPASEAFSDNSFEMGDYLSRMTVHGKKVFNAERNDRRYYPRYPIKVKELSSKIRKLGQLGKQIKTCIEDRDCKAKSTCQDGQCICNTGSILFDGKCRALRAPYTSCNGDEICPGNSECIHGYCQCVQESELHNGMCVLKKYLANIGESCSTSVKLPTNTTKLARFCAGGSICKDGWCVCGTGMYVDRSTMRCVEKVKRIRRWMTSWRKCLSENCDSICKTQRGCFKKSKNFSRSETFQKQKLTE